MYQILEVPQWLNHHQKRHKHIDVNWELKLSHNVVVGKWLQSKNDLKVEKDNIRDHIWK